MISSPPFGIGKWRYFSSKTFPEIFRPRSWKNQAARDNYNSHVKQSRLLVSLYFSSSMPPHRDHAPMPSYCFPFLHTKFSLFFYFSMMFFCRTAILCLQLLSLIQDCYNQGKSGGKGSFSHWSGKVRKSRSFVKSQGRISKSQGNFFSPSGYLYSPLVLIF